MNRMMKRSGFVVTLLLLAGLVACEKSGETALIGKGTDHLSLESGQHADKAAVVVADQGGGVRVATAAVVDNSDAGQAVLVAVISKDQSAEEKAIEAGVISKADDMREEPFRDAKAVKKLAVGEKLAIVARQGGWYKVKAGKATGWVHMLSVRKGDAKKAGGSDSGLLALASGRAGTGKVVATTGVRGLNEEELKAATFNEAELQRAEANASSKADAATFARQGKLAARPFDYLPAK